ncbi:alpha-ketoacid dehydrogenase subunit beta [Amycolatopsis sp. RM579]|uniref:Alpha-ketoacid dehydrogenase subunit beta n=2 Tax=Amycolatopsis pithecellobii TaxID=664692 RepID=A0A6N7YUR1_9PSEU|nr:alpha-ketoacid dehydrogenase subunit beta [Amycolatopsis pithecellobii]
MKAAIHEALDEALTEDPRVFLLGEDVADPGGGISGVTLGLSAKHGADRVLDTPISEAAILGAAVGAALEGQRPIAEIMIMDFIAIAMDQIVNAAAKARFMSAGRTTCPLTIRTMTMGGSGAGATHTQSLEGWFMGVPGLKVIVPSTPADAKGLLRTAIADPDPCLFVESRILYGVRGEVPPGEHRVPLGKADVKRPGTDATIVTYGRGVHESLAAADILREAGIDVEVLDLRTLVPLDMRTVLGSVARTRRAVVVHHATRFAGPGAEVAAQIADQLFGQLAAPVARVGGAFRPNAAKALEARTSPTPDRIVEAVRATMEISR